MSYNFQFWKELLWAALIAAIVTAGQIVVASDLEKVTDWRVWALSLVTACARAVVAIIVTKLTQPPATPERREGE